MNIQECQTGVHEGESLALSPRDFQRQRPWEHLAYPKALLPWVYPEDPWELLLASNALLGASAEVQKGVGDPCYRRRFLADAWERVGNLLDRRHSLGWMQFGRQIEAMTGPALPEPVRRLLPSSAPQVLEDLWEAYRVGVIRQAWEQVPPDPRGDWRVRSLFPPFPDPEAAEVPSAPVEPDGDLWLTWSEPEAGRLEPLLVCLGAMPHPGESYEFRHSESGWSLGATLTGHPLALDYSDADPLLRALWHHQEGVWVGAETKS